MIRLSLSRIRDMSDHYTTEELYVALAYNAAKMTREMIEDLAHDKEFELPSKDTFKKMIIDQMFVVQPELINEGDDSDMFDGGKEVNELYNNDFLKINLHNAVSYIVDNDPALTEIKLKIVP